MGVFRLASMRALAVVTALVLGADLSSSMLAAGERGLLTDNRSVNALGSDADPQYATGCRWAPGPVGANFCFTVNGSGTRVSSMVIQYTAAANICKSTYQFRYTPQLAPRKTVTHTVSGCVVGQGAYRLAVGHHLTDKTTACARVKNNQTEGKYTDWYCFNIKK